MYPYQRTPMGNPYISPIWWVFMGYNPHESLENTNYHGYTVRGTPNCPLHIDLGNIWYRYSVFTNSPAGNKTFTRTKWLNILNSERYLKGLKSTS